MHPAFRDLRRLMASPVPYVIGAQIYGLYHAGYMYTNGRARLDTCMAIMVAAPVLGPAYFIANCIEDKTNPPRKL